MSFDHRWPPVHLGDYSIDTEAVTNNRALTGLDAGTTGHSVWTTGVAVNWCNQD